MEDDAKWQARAEGLILLHSTAFFLIFYDILKSKQPTVEKAFLDFYFIVTVKEKLTESFLAWWEMYIGMTRTISEANYTVKSRETTTYLIWLGIDHHIWEFSASTYIPRVQFRMHFISGRSGTHSWKRGLFQNDSEAVDLYKFRCNGCNMYL